MRSPAIRLSMVLMVVTVNLVFLANLIGLIPDDSKSALEMRKRLSETLALQFSSAADKGDFQGIRYTIRSVVERYDDIRSAAIRTDQGELIAVAGEHLAHWKMPSGVKSTPTHVHVPVYKENKKWAVVEIRFAPLWKGYIADGMANSFIGLLAFIGTSGFLCYFFIIKRTLRELDPSAVVPERVQTAFDVLQEGVLILDRNEQIVMANTSFANLFGRSPASMIGLKGSELGWLDHHSPREFQQLPWFDVLDGGLEKKGASLCIKNSDGQDIKLMVSAAKVSDNAGNCRGALLTFDDITQLEEKNFELTDTIEKLRLANEEIQSKSMELETLANRDPLTLCLNRRSLSHQFKELFKRANETGAHLSCLMIDIDLFKSVNDNYGHAVGDQVIRAVADVLRSSTRDTDLVGRYGGEEFCVVLANLYLDKAAQIAERFRKALEKRSCSGVEVTISIGVSTLESNTSQPDDLINQADKALYAAKKSGRNRVVTWGQDFKALAAESSSKQQTGNRPPTAAPVEDEDRDALLKKVKELEGLLEKRTLELKHYEMYDFTTGLPTRTLFEDRIAHEIARAKRKKHLVAVLSMSIETIQRIHETLGHNAAELLMTECGRRLISVLRENIDTVALLEDLEAKSSISRSHEKEFSILLTDIKRVDNVTWVMKRLLDAFKKPFRLKNTELYVSAYFGVSIFPNDGQTSEALCRNAARACSHARENKKKERYFFFSKELNKRAVSQLKMENLLHSAISNKELLLHYQPKIDAVSREVTGFEALLRWQSPSLGLVPPDQFISVAEQSGQIDGIGQWVIYNACRQLRIWIDRGLNVGTMAVNISGVQLRHSTLPYLIQSILDKFSINPQLLELELTESSLVDMQDRSFSMLRQFKEMGLQVTLDDFGTGYSSLSYLRNMPLGCIKIDRSFVNDIDKDQNANKLIASIVSMAHKLGLKVVAEGVEEEHQVRHLAALGCEYLQGYYFSRPVPQEQVPDLLLDSPAIHCA